MTATVFRPAAGVAIKTVETALRNHPGGHINTEAPRYAFSRHDRIFQSDVGLRSKPSQAWSGAPPPAGRPRTQARRARPEDRALPIVSMSSGRIFLDRVARQQCPSPLHRQAQINMHFSDDRPKPDISTLRRIGHFYFALTGSNLKCRRKMIMSYLSKVEMSY
jgi:hypothetical protein